MFKFRPKFRLHRRLAVDSTLFGVLLTLVVAAADLAGLLSPLELWLYDQRALRCQRWTPAPTDRLVHVDIDDAAQNAIGRFPWHRSVLAEVVDEIHRAGAKAIALDLLLSEPQNLEWRPDPGAAESPAGEKVSKKVDHDARLAEAIRRAGNVVVAARLPFRQEGTTEAYAAMRDALAQRPTLAEADVVAALKARGFASDDLHQKVAADFYGARRAALFRRIKSERHDLSEEQLRGRVLPGVDTTLDSPLLNAFNGEFERVSAVREFRRFALPGDASRPRLFTSSVSEPPIVPVAAAASAGGFVDYLQSADGRVRSLPLFMEADGLVYPQFAVALACRFLGVDPAAIRLTDRDARVPRPGGDLVVPVRTVPASETFDVDAGRDVPMVAGVSWFGGRDWTAMYDRLPGEKRQHLSIARVWNACILRRSIERNTKLAGLAVGAVTQELKGLSSGFRNKLPSHLPLGADPERDESLIRSLLAEAEFEEQALSAEDPASLSARQKLVLKALRELRHIAGENAELRGQLATTRAELRSALDGRAVLLGWVATASIADFLPTSLHPRCPGVVMHGVIFNQIVNGEVWRTLPDWATVLATVVAGLLTTLAVSVLPPPKALAAAVLLLAGYLLANGFLLFDYGNLVLGAAGPVVAVGAVWSGGTLAKLLFERVERARITRRFRSYADPKVVDFVLKHPEMNIFEGQVRELTVVYADLVGFTTLTETMGPATVQLLNDLWSALVPVIRANDALVNKFLGDGAMFFYGAPEQSPHHARDAVRTVLAVREELARWNERAAAKGWPPQKMRFGISTGNMVVGDAGAPQQERTDYTVIGDYSNLGARLESANKAVGTTILMTERTVELAGEGFLFRPVGRLCVVGKQASVMTYEVLARLEDASDEQKQLAAHTRAMVEAFLAGRVKECMDAVERMEAAHGRSKLTELYRERCAYFLQDPAPAPFDCQIVLSEK